MLVIYTERNCLFNSCFNHPIVELCPALNITSKLKPSTSATFSGVAVRFTCDDHSMLQGPQLIRCLSGKWNFNPPICLSSES